VFDTLSAAFVLRDKVWFVCPAVQLEGYLRDRHYVLHVDSDVANAPRHLFIHETAAKRARQAYSSSTVYAFYRRACPCTGL